MTEKRISSIYEAFRRIGINMTRHTGDVGIEIETESKGAYDPPNMTFWSNHRDGSLRDFGIEYVLKAPVPYHRVYEALVEWNDRVKKQYRLIPDSYTTSVHIHLNFLNNTPLEMMNFITTYILVENLLIKFSGPDRLSNLFCLPVCDAEGNLSLAKNLSKAFQNLQYKRLAPPEEGAKYAALNLANIVKLGTLEVRSMRGTTDIEVMKDWVDILRAIKDFSCQENLTPQDIVGMYGKQGTEIVYTIFGDFVKKLDLSNAKELLEKNLWYVADFSKSINPTDKFWGLPKPKKEYKEFNITELNKISADLYDSEYNKLPYHLKITVDERFARIMNVSTREVTFAHDDF